MNHPHIVKYVGSFKKVQPFVVACFSILIAICNAHSMCFKGRCLNILMEFCSGGDLSALIRSHRSAAKQLDREKVMVWVGQLLGALQHCHGLCVLHRDIKPANILITKDASLKLGLS